MRTHAKTAMATLITTIALALALTATSATARSYSVTEKEWEILFRELSFRTSTDTITCPITLLGHFAERTIPKIFGSQVGVIKHAEPRSSAAPPCTGGTLTILSATLPWRINYNGFTGTLPVIQALRQSIIGIAFRLRTPGGVGCLFGTTAAEPAFGENIIGANGRVESLSVDPNSRIRLGGGFLCSLSGTASFSGLGTVLNLPGNAAITVTLI